MGAPEGAPTRLVVAGQEYEVRWVDDLRAGLARDADGNRVGHSDHGAGYMAIRVDGMSATQARDTLLHEIIHAVLALADLDGAKDHFRSSDASERVVNVLATHLLDTLRRNPGLAEFLIDG